MWADVIRDFAKHLRWDVEQVLDRHTFAEFYCVWCGGIGGGLRRAGNNPNARRDKINRMRAEKGLPPMKPAEVR